MTWLWQLLVLLIVFAWPLAVLPLLIWLERRVCAWMQDRVGPNRVGPFGLLQPLADVIKLTFKEDVIPLRVDKVLYVIAPIFAFVPGMIALCVIPIGAPFYMEDKLIHFQAADLNVGILFLFAVVTLGAYSLTFGGWASRSKYSQLGGIRATAQVISYEIALGLSFLAVMMVTADPARGISGYMVSDMVFNQIRVPSETDPTGYVCSYAFGFIPLSWNLFVQPLAFIIFFTAALAETNRAPFDMPEAEPELVGGYHTEYSSFKFAMFFMGEYLGVLNWSALITLLFLGGWHMPLMPVVPKADIDGLIFALIGLVVFAVKTLFVVFVFIWIRWTFPRFRYDQLMGLGWKILIPLGLANLVITALLTI